MVGARELGQSREHAGQEYVKRRGNDAFYRSTTVRRKDLMQDEYAFKARGCALKEDRNMH